MKMQITKEDFDRAVSVPWDGSTCMVAQAMNRCGIRENSLMFAIRHGIDDIQGKFDQGHFYKNMKLLEEVKQSLPIEFELKETA